MNVNDPLPPDDEFSSVLAAWDEALAAGGAPRAAATGSPELLSRLERGLACLQRLQALNQRSPSSSRPATDTSPLDSQPSDSDGTVSSVRGAVHRYTLTRLHATGGIGRVWLAYDGDLCREVALKELRPERSQDRGFADRFLREAQVTGRLEHPGIVPVYELTRCAEDGQLFYTMRFIKGRTLSDAIRSYHDKRVAGRADPLERAALLNAFVATCNAVAYAHSRGVIHRDLKGQNVVLGDFGEVIVLDWGFAKVLDRVDNPTAEAPADYAMEADPSQTIPGQVIGTPAYMAPEQAEGLADRVDRRTDVYGLGTILYELLTGRPPFAGPDVAGVLRQVREAEPERPRQVSTEVPRALEAVCLRALAKDPAKRYASAADLAREVQRWLADEPVAAYPEPPAARLWRWARRHRTLSASLAVLMMSAFIGGIVVREQRARNELRVQTAEKVAAAERKARDEIATTAYLKHIALAQEAVSANQLYRADELLERCDPSLRDWEWNHLQRRTHRCLLTLRGHAPGQSENHNIRCVVYRPDGLELASAGVDGTIRLWDASTGRARVLPGHVGGVFRLAYRPTDGRYLASTGVKDGKVRVWDTATEKEIFNCSHENPAVLGVAYSPDGLLLASSSWDKTVRFWDAADGRPVGSPIRHTSELGVLAFHPLNGRQVAVAAFDKTVRLWDVPSGDGPTGPPVRTYEGGAGVNAILAFSPNGHYLATSGGDNRIVRVWDVTNDREPIWSLRGRTDALPVVAFSPNGRFLAVASVDQTVRILNAYSGQAVRTLHGHRAMLGSVAYSPDSRQLATAGNDAIVKVWDLTDLKTNAGPECVPIGRHARGVSSLAFSPDSADLISAGADGVVRFWNPASGRQPHPLLVLGSPPLVLAAVVNARVVTIDPEVRKLELHRDAIISVAFSPDGKRTATASRDGTVIVRDAATGREIFSLPAPTGPVHGVVFGAGGQRLATANGDRTVTLWDAASGREIRTLHADGEVIQSVALSPDGRWLAAVDHAGTLKVWDADSGDMICDRPAQSGNPTEGLILALRAVPASRPPVRSVSCVVFSSDGKRLAWTGEDGTVTIWKVSALAAPSASWPDTVAEPVTCYGHAGLVMSLVFSPDGKRLVSADEDGVVKLWDTGTGQEAFTLNGHKGIVRSVAFSPDARFIAAAGDDGTITIWDGTPLDRDPR